MSKETLKKLYYYSTFDGGIYKRKTTRYPAFIMNMLECNSDYVLRVKDALAEAGIGATLYSRADYNTDGCTRQPQVRLNSQGHPLLERLRKRIYVDGRKCIDPHMLTMLDAEALAIIFMADGSRKVDRRCDATPIYLLNTKGYSYGDNWLLKKALKEKLDLEFNIHRQNDYWYLYLRTKDSAKFEELVAPFITPSFMYKLGRQAPREVGGDIVCSSQGCEEVGGNDQPLSLTE